MHTSWEQYNTIDRASHSSNSTKKPFEIGVSRNFQSQAQDVEELIGPVIATDPEGLYKSPASALGF